jgi:hypothetical protein
MKQQVLAETNGSDMMKALKEAINVGWLVHSITVSASNYWIAIVYKEETT